MFGVVSLDVYTTFPTESSVVCVERSDLCVVSMGVVLSVGVNTSFLHPTQDEWLPSF